MHLCIHFWKLKDSKYLLWKQETDTLPDGKEKTGRTLMANIIDTCGYVLKTEETGQKELLNGAGTKWLSSVFFSENVEGIRPELTPFHIKFSEHVDNLLNLEWDVYNNRDIITDHNSGSFNSIVFVKDILNLHMRAALTLAKNNGFISSINVVDQDKIEITEENNINYYKRFFFFFTLIVLPWWLISLSSPSSSLCTSIAVCKIT